MNNSINSVFLAIGLLLSTATPALCDANSSSSSKANSSSRLAAMPESVAGFCSGFVVGTPICFTRYLRRETVNAAHGFVGTIAKNDDNPYLLVPVGICCLPFAGLIAFVESPVYAFKNAWMSDKPFSKEQFSLGELEDPKND